MRKMSTLLAAATLLCGLASPALALEVAGGANAGIYNMYLWRGFDLSGSKPVAQGGADVSAGNFTFSWWTNLQLASDAGEGFKSGEATETDIIVDYSTDLGELVSLSVGNCFYNLDGMDDTHEAYLGLTLNTLLSPALTVYYDWDEAEGDGLYYTLAVGHEISLAEPLTLSLGALVGYNQESDYSVGDYSDFHNYELSAGLDYALTENLSLGLSCLFSEGLSDEARDAIDSEFLSGVSIALSF